MNRLGKRSNPVSTIPEAKSPKIGRAGLEITTPTDPTLTRSGLSHIACAYNHKRDLVLVYGHKAKRSLFILTPDGYLVTNIELGPARNLVEHPNLLCANFSDEQILIEIFKYTLFISTDYRMDVVDHRGSVFDCDDNGNIYFSINHERRIAIHSSDFRFLSNFPEYPTHTGEIIALTIKGDLMVVLSESSSFSDCGWNDNIRKIHKYSLTTDKLIQRCIITDFCAFVPDLICIDRLENVLLVELKKSNRYCVLDKDDRVSNYRLVGSNPFQFRKAGFSITNSLELIIVFKGEQIGIYNINKH